MAGDSVPWCEAIQALVDPAPGASEAPAVVRNLSAQGWRPRVDRRWWFIGEGCASSSGNEGSSRAARLELDFHRLRHLSRRGHRDRTRGHIGHWPGWHSELCRTNGRRFEFVRKDKWVSVSV